MKKCSSETYHIFFNNLANPLRVRIISELKTKPLSVTKLAKKINEEQSKISHALLSLKLCNIVTAKTKGKERIYSLNKRTIVPILKLIDKHSNTFCKSGCKCGVCGK